MSCETPDMKFRPWNGTGEEAVATRDSMIALLLSEDIWDSQRIDGTSKEECMDPKFPEGTFLAVFYDDLAAVGYVLFVPKAPGVWEQHTAFDKEHRGAYALEAVRLSHKAMFMQTPCFHLISYCPEWHPAARFFAQKLGAEYAFRNQNAYTRDGRKQWADVFSLTLVAWAYDVHGEYEDIGEQWHEEVFAKLEPHHEDDPAHNGFLGIAIEMAKYSPQKAVALYNSYAQIAGYHPANLVATHTSGLCVIDIGNAWITMAGDKVAAAVPKPCPPLEQSQQSQVPVQASTALPLPAVPDASKSEPSPASPT